MTYIYILPVVLAILLIYPIYLVFNKLINITGYMNIGIYISAVSSIFIIEGISALGTLIDNSLLSGISLFNIQNVVVLYIVGTISVISLWLGIGDILKVSDSQNSRVAYLERKLSEAESVQAISKTLSSPVLTLHEKLLKVVDIIVKDVRAEKGSIMLNNGKDELEVMASTDRSLIGIRQPISAGIAGLVVTEGKSLNVEDIKLDNRFKKGYLEKYRKDSFLIIPIKIRDQVMGVLNVNDKIGMEPGFSEDDKNFLEGVISNISSFIENAEILKQLEEEMEFMSFRLKEDK